MNAPVARLATAVACGYVSIGAGIQVLPETARERFGAGSWATGAAVTAASVAAVFARPLAGRRADTHGPRGVVALGGALAALGALGQLVAPSLAWLVLARLLIGAGEGALFTAAIAWVLTAAPVERRGRIVGHFGLSMWGGLAAGPPLAAALAAATSTDTVWWACALLPLPPAVAVLAARRGGEATAAGGKRAAANGEAAWAGGDVAGVAAGDSSGATRAVAAGRRAHGPRAFFPREVARPAVVLALASFGYGTLTAFLVLRFDSAIALGLFGGAFLLCRLVGSPLVDRVAAPRLVAVCALVEALGLVLIAAGMLAGVVLCGFGTALVYPALATLVADRVGPQQRGAAVGALTSSWDAGITLAGPVGGVLGLTGPFLLGALGALAAAGVVLTPAAAVISPRAPRKPAATRRSGPV